MRNDDEDKVLKNIPIRGSLELLAYGDLAFLAWRELKIARNISKREQD